MKNTSIKIPIHNNNTSCYVPAQYGMCHILVICYTSSNLIILLTTYFTLITCLKVNILKTSIILLDYEFNNINYLSIVLKCKQYDSLKLCKYA